MSVFVIPDLRSLTRLVTKHYPAYDVPRIHGMVFEFVRFFRLKQKLNDVNPREAVLAPSYAVDQVWHLFLQDTVQYQQACGASFIHHDPKGTFDGTYQARLKRTREEYEAEYHEAPPAEFWQDEEVLVPSSPPPPAARIRRNQISHTVLVPRTATHVSKRPREPTFNAFVKQISGKTTALHTVPMCMPMIRFLRMVSDSTTVPLDMFVLRVGGGILDDTKLLSDYPSIVADADVTFHMVQNIRGC